MSYSISISNYNNTESIYNQTQMKKELNEQNYSKVSHLFFDFLKIQYLNDYNQFVSCFESLPKYPYIHEGIDSGIYNPITRKIEYNKEVLEKEGYINADSLEGLVNQNEFVNNLIAPICKTLAEDPLDKIEISFKLHRRPMQAGNIGELKGLGPHNDYDADGVAVIKVAQENITGGENQLVDNNYPMVLTEDTIPNNGDIVLVYNKNIRHQLTSMKLIDTNLPGQRDVVVMDLKKI